MKKLILFVFVAFGLISCKKTPKSDQEKFGYAVGVQTGQTLKRNAVALDSKMLHQGLADVLENKRLELPPEEIESSIRKLAEMVNAAVVQESQANLTKAKEVLDRYQKDPSYKTTQSGLIYKIIKEGSGPLLKDAPFATVHYTGKFPDGRVFDSSKSRGSPNEVQVKTMIPGWIEALKMMKVGSEMEIVLPPELGYGAASNQIIPGNSVLIFEIELVGVRNK